jgi:hypothetical protein
MGTTLPTSTSTRRWIGRLARLGLILVALVFVGVWVGRKTSRRMPNVRVQRAEVTEQSLGPGDLRIYNADSSVDLVLHGTQVLAGLSPKTAARIRDEMQKSADKDTSGLGGLISQTVKQTVANAITTHVAYRVADIADMRYEDGQLIIEQRGGGTTRLFGDAKVNGREQGKTFRPEDAERFIAAVRARKREMESGARRF